jgi:hypothetical protein
VPSRVTKAGSGMDRSALICTFRLTLFACAFVFVGCGGNGNRLQKTACWLTSVSAIPQPARVLGGAFAHIYVTIPDVQIKASVSAGNNDSGGIDLTPSLSQNTQQVDLLGRAVNQCFLATLGATTALQPGSYQQIRIMLARNATVITNNVCGSSANCVMLSSLRIRHSRSCYPARQTLASRFRPDRLQADNS